MQADDILSLNISTVSERKCTVFEIVSSLEILYSGNPSLGVKDIHRHGKQCWKFSQVVIKTPDFLGFV